MNATYNIPATFHVAFAFFAIKNGTDSIVSSKKKTNWYKGWWSKSKMYENIVYLFSSMGVQRWTDEKSHGLLYQQSC